jgi:hypothetical protein
MLVTIRGIGRPLKLITVGEKNRCSSCAVISRLNRGYAVRSIEVTIPVLLEKASLLVKPLTSLQLRS